MKKTGIFNFILLYLPQRAGIRHIKYNSNSKMTSSTLVIIFDSKVNFSNLG